MTTEPAAAPTDGTPASKLTKPLRELAALVLLGATAVFLFVALLDLMIPVDFDDNDFTSRSSRSFGGFINLTTIGLPLLAVLLANHIHPPVARAKLITLVALIEYAVAAFFGVIFGLLVGVVVIITDIGARAGFETFLTRLAWVAVLGVAAYALVRVGRGLYFIPKPTPQPGQYGYPQQPGYAQPPPYGQPGYPQYAQHTAQYQQQPYSQQPYPQQPYPQQPAAQQPAPQAYPTSAPPAAPSPPPPTPAPPAPGQPEEGHTQLINPASQQPSAGYAPPPSAHGQGDDEPPTQIYQQR
ncbi:hypothetical protein [Micromonospora sp. CPCC 206061]|uniref:hypothetical protein n=1 Tax=Micromonospora sp. CPCC 206061 TaxID=3122410 RepID=UPI002FF1C9A9